MKFKKIFSFLICGLVFTSLLSCNNKTQDTNTPTGKREIKNIEITDDKYRNYYEIFVRSFNDTNGDGIGDLKGVTAKLDYIKDLGYNGIWLMPITKGNSYHGYDVVDYYSVEPAYGTMADYDELITKAHEKGIKIIIDLVVNHSSNQNPWFKSAVKYIQDNGAPGGTYGDYYVFADQRFAKYTGIPNTFYYYESVFDSAMPDLNLSSNNVRNEIKNIMKFWFDHGSDGFRLDAVTWFFNEQVNKNVEFLSWLNTEAKKINPNAYIVGEAWVNDNMSIKEYYASGIDSFFTFPLSSGEGMINQCLNMLSQKNGKNFGETLTTLQRVYGTHIMAPFLANHDMNRVANFGVTLEKTCMEYGLLSLMNGALFTYYGDEIGMFGSGTDPNRRLPILWSELNKDGYCTYSPGSAQANDKTYSFGSVKTQLEDNNSILNYYKYANYIRNANPEIARGTTKVLQAGYTCDNQNVCVFQREYGGKVITIVVNLDPDFTREVVFDKSVINYQSMTEYLCVNYEKEVTLDEKTNTMSIPAYSYAILR